MPDLESQLARIRAGKMYNDLTAELVAARQHAVL
jgi:maltose O-acetyltransferase